LALKNSCRKHILTEEHGLRPDKIASMPIHRSGQLLPASLLLALCASAAAQTPPQRLGLCASCHGERGIATANALPNLAGQNLDYLRSAIEQYRSGARDVAAMRAAIGMVGKSELDDILQWYALQPASGAK
jgi:cytochrome c553